MSKLILYSISIVIFVLTGVICLFKNPIFSVLFFLVLIVLVALLLIFFNVYYMALTLIIIYAGAVVVLFFFLIFTLQKNFKLLGNYKLYLPNNLILFLFFIFNFFFCVILKNFTSDMQHILFWSKRKVDYEIFSENLFSEYFIFIGITVLVMLMVLIMAIIISKKATNRTFITVGASFKRDKLLKTRILRAIKK